MKQLHIFSKDSGDEQLHLKCRINNKIHKNLESNIFRFKITKNDSVFL